MASACRNSSRCQRAQRQSPANPACMRSPLFAVKRADHAKPNWRGLRVWLLSLRTAKGIFGIVSAALSLASKFRFLGACPSNRCSNPSEFDLSVDYEQALSPLEYRSDAASAAECAGLRAQGPRLAVYRWAGAGEFGSQGDHGQLCEWARPAAVRSAHDGFAFAAWLCKRALFVAAHC